MSVIPPSPRFCLRRTPEGIYYQIPLIYEYGWEQWCKAVLVAADIVDIHPAQNPVPAYAVRVNLDRLTYEKPLEAPE